MRASSSMRWLLAASLLVAVSGCSTVKGWFGGKGKADEKPTEPAELVDFTPSVSVAKLWTAKAGKGDAAAIKAAIPQVTAADGTPIHAGKDEFAKALALIKDGKPVKYEGVIGPVSFDQYGDITGPFRLWRIQDGKVTTVGEMSADEVEKIKAGQ